MLFYYSATIDQFRAIEIIAALIIGQSLIVFMVAGLCSLPRGGEKVARKPIACKVISQTFFIYFYFPLFCKGCSA